MCCTRSCFPLRFGAITMGQAMLTAVELSSFKSFDEAKLSLGPLTVIIGANASGKSNIRDAFRFLHGIGRGYSLADIIGGKYGAGGQVEWMPIRGFGTEIMRFGSDKLTISVNLRLSTPGPLITYALTIAKPDGDQGGFRVVRERLSYPYSTVFTTHPGSDDPVHSQPLDDDELFIRMDKTGSQRKFGNRVSVRPDRPAISQLAGKKNVNKAHKDLATRVLEELAEFRFLDLVPDLMRQPSFPGQSVLGDNGQNLPTVLQGICTNSSRKSVLIDWIRELTPMDVIDFEFPLNAQTGLVQLSLRTSDGQSVSSYSASDGTLRFLAMLAALLTEQNSGLYFFEEIDNGIHPARLRLLVDFLETQTEKGRAQVVTTTHSPELLSMIGETTFQHTSVVYNRGDGTGSHIKELRTFPAISRLREQQGLGQLHSSGWLENAIMFGMDEESAA